MAFSVFAWIVSNALVLFDIGRTLHWAVIAMFFRGELLNEEFLRAQLDPMRVGDQPDGERQFAVDQMDLGYLKNCIVNLNFHGIFYEGEAKWFFRNAKVRNRLQRAYREQVGRRPPANLDANGYTMWGPPLHKIGRFHRDRMTDCILTRLRASLEAEDNRRRE